MRQIEPSCLQKLKSGMHPFCSVFTLMLRFCSVPWGGFEPPISQTKNRPSDHSALDRLTISTAQQSPLFVCCSRLLHVLPIWFFECIVLVQWWMVCYHKKLGWPDQFGFVSGPCCVDACFCFSLENVAWFSLEGDLGGFRFRKALPPVSYKTICMVLNVWTYGH